MIQSSAYRHARQDSEFLQICFQLNYDKPFTLNVLERFSSEDQALQYLRYNL